MTDEEPTRVTPIWTMGRMCDELLRDYTPNQIQVQTDRRRFLEGLAAWKGF